MAIQQVISGAPFPGIIPFLSGGASFTAVLMDASAEKVAMRVFVPRSGTLDAFEFRSSLVTNTSNGVKISFQGIDASGNPDGTVLAYRVVTPAVGWNTPAKMTSDGTDSGTPLTVARGQILYCVVEFQSFVSGDAVEVSSMGGINSINNIFVNQFTSSWSKIADRGLYMTLRYSDGSYVAPFGYNLPRSTSLGAKVITSTGATDEAGLIFSYPAPVLLGGALIFCKPAGNCEFRFYRSDDRVNPVFTYSQDKDDTTSTTVADYHYFPFPSDIRIEANEECIISVLSTDTTGTDVSYYEAPSSAYLELMEMGRAWRWLSRADLGAWTEVTARRPYISPVITGLDHEIGGQPSTGFEGIL